MGRGKGWGGVGGQNVKANLLFGLMYVSTTSYPHVQSGPSWCGGTHVACTEPWPPTPSDSFLIKWNVSPTSLLKIWCRTSLIGRNTLIGMFPAAMFQHLVVDYGTEDWNSSSNTASMVLKYHIEKFSHFIITPTIQNEAETLTGVT